MWQGVGAGGAKSGDGRLGRMTKQGNKQAKLRLGPARLLTASAKQIRPRPSPEQWSLSTAGAGFLR